MSILEREELLQTYSDIYKDVYGVRPRDVAFGTNKEIIDEIRALEQSLIAVMEEEHTLETRRLVSLTAKIKEEMLKGSSFEEVIESLMEKHRAMGDEEHLEYNLGVRFGSIKTLRGLHKENKL